MKYRSFGQTGWQVSEIGFGGARIGGIFAGSSGRKDALTTLRASFDSGINFYDTADMYAQGESERLIGEAFRQQRSRIYIATKGGYVLPTQRRYVAMIKPLAKAVIKSVGLKRSALPAGIGGQLAQDFSPAYIRRAVDQSLRRLQTDYIDLYQLHSPPLALLASASLDDTLSSLEKLKTEGKIRHYGLALDAADHAEACFSRRTISTLQLPFGLLDPEAGDRIIDQAALHELGVIARGCFGGGVLKETLTEEHLRATEPKWKRVLELRNTARGMGRSVLEVALQFSLGLKSISVTILGMRTPSHQKDVLSCYAAPPLNGAEMSALFPDRHLGHASNAK